MIITLWYRRIYANVQEKKFVSFVVILVFKKKKILTQNKLFYLQDIFRYMESGSFDLNIKI